MIDLAQSIGLIAVGLTTIVLNINVIKLRIKIQELEKNSRNNQ